MLTAPAFSAEKFHRNRLFEGIEPELLRQLTCDVETEVFAEGEVIFQEGAPGDRLYLVGEGSVQITKPGRGGKPETLGFIEVGNFFGEMALLDGEPRSATAAAVARTVLGVVDDPTFQRILENAPSQLHLNFLRSVTQRLRHINSHFISEMMRQERLSMVGSMASMILHDLNNPISTVRCCCDVIARDSSDPALLEAASLLDGAVEGMRGMTQELLDFTRGSIALRKEKTTVAQLLAKLGDQWRPLLHPYHVKLITEIRADVPLEVDVGRFLRLFGNLVKNARDAMPTGGTITIATEPAANEIIFRVTDTGVGIPPELLPRLFEPFVTHGKENGTGLGMAIAKSVVDAHRGTISISSEVAHGTTIEIRLPTEPTD